MDTASCVVATFLRDRRHMMQHFASFDVRWINISMKQFNFDDDDVSLRYLYEHSTNCTLKQHKRKTRKSIPNHHCHHHKDHLSQSINDPVSNVKQNQIESNTSFTRPLSTKSHPSLITKLRSTQSPTIRQSKDYTWLEHAISEDDEEWDDITINKLLLTDRLNIIPRHRYIHHHSV